MHCFSAVQSLAWFAKEYLFLLNVLFVLFSTFKCAVNHIEFLDNKCFCLSMTTQSAVYV